MWWFVVLTSSSLVTLVSSSEFNVYSDSKQGDDDILHIQTDCAATLSGRTRITVTSSQDVNVRVVCRNDHVAQPVPADKVHYIQEVAFGKEDDEPCQFDKKVDSNVYTVMLYVAQIDKESGFAISQLRHDFLVTCTYDEKGASVSEEKEISSDNIGFHEHIQEIGGAITADITLYLEKANGDLASSPVPLGTTVRLVANVTSGDEYIRPLTCSASNGVYNHTVLLAGCGDGIVFKKEMGFTTKARQMFSPFFPAFRLRGNPSLVYACKFVSCESSCDGSSCSKEKLEDRKKRAVEGREYHVTSNSFTIEGSKKDPHVIHVDATKPKPVNKSNFRY
ncbi:hypothetical protein LOTGIDRAFT_233448 [Lottia gigantea]|uniref:Vitelline envelope sperm lysin receptor C-terminal domain-containing protein n=1 Tax=Lottia gigantea TaxID=225164 RepID=V4AEB4_LOTGI|nr:hypothetical protein LOTGIDRAFT_233448 [Lottia gigantea]ESO91696.1 hypothetical protein LOTGIDRAFT_233448 [Lottia gigantea]